MEFKRRIQKLKELIKVSKIRKREDGWYVISEKDSKNLGGPYTSKEKAQKRLKEIEYFKYKD